MTHFSRPQDVTPLGKEQAALILAIPGEVRGLALKPNLDYIAAFRGKGDVAKLEEAMAALGVPLLHKDIKPMKFYPIGYDIIGMALMEDVLGMKPEDFFHMGVFGMKSSWFFRILFKYFISPSLTIKQAPYVWHEHYTVGSLEPMEVDEQNGHVVLALKNFLLFRRSLCHNVRGYIAGVWQMVVNANVSVEERACQLEGALSHEFVISWDPAVTRTTHAWKKE